MQEILERSVKTPKNYTIVMLTFFVFLLIFNSEKVGVNPSGLVKLPSADKIVEEK